jgi:3-dehydroquinate synthase class II
VYNCLDRPAVFFSIPEHLAQEIGNYPFILRFSFQKSEVTPEEIRTKIDAIDTANVNARLGLKSQNTPTVCRSVVVNSHHRRIRYCNTGLLVCGDGLHFEYGWSRRRVRAVERHESVDRYCVDRSRRIPNRRRGYARGSTWKMSLLVSESNESPYV